MGREWLFEASSKPHETYQGSPEAPDPAYDPPTPQRPESKFEALATSAGTPALEDIARGHQAMPEAADT